MKNVKYFDRAEKLNVEKYIAGKAIILRFGTVYGISTSCNRVRFDLVVNAMTVDAIKNRKLTVYGGEQWRPLVHVNDIGRLIAGMVQSNDFIDRNKIYNVASENMLISDIAKIVQKHTGCSIETVDQKYEDLRDYRVSSEKARTELNFEPIYNVEGGVVGIKALVESGRVKDTSNPLYRNNIYLT